MRDNSDYLAGLPRKRMAAAAVLLDTKQRMLLVKPTYRAHWLLPGGVIEENDSPRRACIREIREETGLQIEPVRLLCVEYRSASDGVTECIQFLFFGGVVTNELAEAIRLPPSELSEHRFVQLTEARHLLSPHLARRTELALQALREGSTLYLEDGAEPASAR